MSTSLDYILLLSRVHIFECLTDNYSNLPFIHLCYLGLNVSASLYSLGRTSITIGSNNASRLAW